MLRLALPLTTTVFLLAQTVSPAPAAGTFVYRRSWAVGQGPFTLASGDLNGDGRKDVVTTNNESVSVLLGTGLGKFAPAVDYPGTTGGLSIALGDLNGDGRPDLVRSGAQPSVYINLGNGTFGPAVTYPVQSGGSGLDLGDVDNDGKRDLVVANYGSNSLSLLRGMGDGTFGPATTVPGVLSPWGIKVVDIDNDGNRDLIVSNVNESTISLFRGNGNGTVAAPAVYPAGPSYPTALTVADLNNDGRLDVVATAVNAATVLLGNSTSGLGAPTSYPATSMYGTPVAVGDVQNDGRVDLVLSGVVLAGLGDGTFRTGWKAVSVRSQLLYDADHNGALDILGVYPGLGGSFLHLFTNVAQTAVSNPATGQRGSVIRVTGTHFRGGESVEVRYKTGLASPASIAICTVSADSRGAFSCRGSIPFGSQAGATGPHELSAKGQTTFARAKTTFTLTN